MAPDAQHWGGASGVGSWPGTDPLEAVRTVLGLLPDLPFLPELPGRSDDYSAVIGLSRKLAGGWNLDFSTGYGYNYLDLNANETANPSMGADSPTDFYVGRSAFGQSTSEVNVSRNYVGLFGTKSFNLALGSQFRIDRFQLEKGSDE